MYIEKKKLSEDAYMVTCTAKHTIRRIAICLLAVFVLGGCFDQLADDAATITINLSRSASRAAYPADEETWSRLVFVIEFSGSSDVPLVRTEPGTETVNVSVPPGYYVIMATAFLDGEVYARGSASAQARIGYLTAVPLILYYTGTNDTTVNIAAIEGVTAPVIGGTPVTAITENDQYSGTVSWEPNHPVFAPATRYTATISLTAKDGYTLQGVAANFFKVEKARTASNLANSGVVTVVFSTTAGTTKDPAVIDLSAVPGVIVPVNGGTPVATITENDQYSGTVTWSPTVTGIFAPNTQYTATITLTAKPGFTLQGVAADSFTVVGASANNSVNSGVVTAVFPETYTEITINIKDIAGVTVPVTGGTAGFSIIDTDQYTGTVTWSPATLPTFPPAFASATLYTATITLIEKAGYTLQGVTANLFTVAGASSVRNSADSGVITAVFPKTDTTISIATITGITAPKAGGAPVPIITATAQYTGTVSWRTSDGVELTGPFVDYNVYIATISLTAKTGYTFHGVAANSFTVTGASSINSVNSSIITATFPLIPYAPGGIGTGGGKVFFYSKEGFTMTDNNQVCHYLEAAPSGSGELAWASSGYTSTTISGTGTAIGTGRKNTALILATDANAPAAKACKELTAGDKTDWFLPSKDEVDILFENRGYVNNLGNASYYCSSGAFTKTFQKTNENDDGWRSDSKDKAHYVRAIRAF